MGCIFEAGIKGSFLDGRVRVALNGYIGEYSGKYHADATNIASSGAAELVNARIGVRKDNCSIELFARNLFDDQSLGITLCASRYRIKR